MTDVTGYLWPTVLLCLAIAGLWLIRGRAAPSSRSKVNPTGLRVAPKSSAVSTALDTTLPSFAEADDDEITAITLSRDVSPLRNIDLAYDDDDTRGIQRWMVSAASQSSAGTRAQNSDRFTANDGMGLYAIADGVGIGPGANCASEESVKRLEEILSGVEFKSTTTVVERVVSAYVTINNDVRQMAAGNPSLGQTATTLTCAFFSPDYNVVVVGHVGDSRFYRLRDGVLTQLTRDHVGSVSHSLSRAVGAADEVFVDIVATRVELGDQFLICSDGLTRVLKDDDVRDVMTESAPGDAARVLIERAERGAAKRDNMTAVVIGLDHFVVGTALV
jgi:protein phosphatase